jgi:hypothetical protein
MRRGTSESLTDGGAALVHDLLQALAESVNHLPPQSESGDAARTLEVNFGVGRPTMCRLPDAFHGFAVFQPVPKNADQGSSKVWRLADALGFGDDPTERFSVIGDQSTLDREFDVVLIDDAGLGYRVQTANDVWPRVLRDESCVWPEWLVLKLSAPVACGDLWRKVVAIEANGEKLRDRCIVTVSINDLRAEGAQVPLALSW